MTVRIECSYTDGGIGQANIVIELPRDDIDDADAIVMAEALTDSPHVELFVPSGDAVLTQVRVTGTTRQVELPPAE